MNNSFPAHMNQNSQEVPETVPDGGVVPPLTRIQTVSSLDQTWQASLMWAPESAITQPHPLLIFLHSWSFDYEQENSAWQAEAVKRNWIYLHPNFRGPNVHPDAGGSLLAQHDILDAINWIQRTYKVDPSRIYLAGSSGGGLMTLLMAGRYPDRFSAASAWVPISDLAEWYRFHTREGVSGIYARNLVSICGGIPGESVEVKEQYRNRSPVTWLANVGDLPLDINAGVHDGHIGSVPITHSLNAFNIIAATRRSPQISEQEMEELLTLRKLSRPLPEDIAHDPTYATEILLRRQSGPARVTIFNGGHIGLPSAACSWLERHAHQTNR